MLRLALVALYGWFGVMQLQDPSVWVGFLPEATGYLPIPGEMLVRLNGWFEVVAAATLLLGVYTRAVAFVLGAHLAGIAITAGGAIGVRDATLAIATFILTLNAPDSWTVDARSARPPENASS